MPHTPGPWETSSNQDNQWDVCGADGGDMIADLSMSEHGEADANLIAASPDMLAVLISALDCWESENMLTDAVVGKMRAAIAKAKAVRR